MAELLLSITFAMGLVVAFAHVANRRFIAPVYDVVANLTAFVCATAASTLMRHWVSAGFAAAAVCCWIWLARRTVRTLRRGHPAKGQVHPGD